MASMATTLSARSNKGNGTYSKNYHNPLPDALQKALAESIAEGVFTNTAYHLYSHRRRDRKVVKPRIVYGIKNVIQSVCQCPHKEVSDGELRQVLPPEATHYGYDSDSDLDDSDDEEEVSLEKASCFDNEGNHDNQVANAHSDDKPAFARTCQIDPEKGSETTPRVHCEYYAAIPNVSANTWQAFIHFVYTKRIHFSPLKSEGLELRRKAKETHRITNPHLPPLVSPKSVYRLAKIVGESSLLLLARKDINTRISPKNVAHEAFSRFSANHKDILDMQLGVLYSNGTLKEVLPQVLQSVGAVVLGEKSHCQPVLEALLLKLSTLLPQPEVKPTMSSSGPAFPSLLERMRTTSVVDRDDGKTSVEASETLRSS